jgi:hypothetical protein
LFVVLLVRRSDHSDDGNRGVHGTANPLDDAQPAGLNSAHAYTASSIIQFAFRAFFQATVYYKLRGQQHVNHDDSRRFFNALTDGQVKPWSGFR